MIEYIPFIVAVIGLLGIVYLLIRIPRAPYYSINEHLDYQIEKLFKKYLTEQKKKGSKKRG